MVATFKILSLALEEGLAQLGPQRAWSSTATTPLTAPGPAQTVLHLGAPFNLGTALPGGRGLLPRSSQGQLLQGLDPVSGPGKPAPPPPSDTTPTRHQTPSPPASGAEGAAGSCPAASAWLQSPEVLMGQQELN